MNLGWEICSQFDVTSGHVNLTVFFSIERSRSSLNLFSLKKFFVFLTIFIHSHGHAFFQAACLALISVRFVYYASSSSCLTSAKEDEFFND